MSEDETKSIFEPEKPDVPEDWVVKPFLDVVAVASDKGKRTKQRDYLAEGAVPVIDQGQDFIGGYIDDVGMAFDGELPVIVFGDHTRAIKYVNHRFAVGADGVKLLKPADCFDPKFFYYLLNSLQIPSRGYSRHFQFLKKFHLPIAPLEQQKRIVAEIEKQFSRLDEAVANLKRVKANLQRYKAAILKAAVEGSLVGDDSSKWKPVLLGELAKTIRNGYSVKPDAESGTRIFRISAVRPLILKVDDVRYLSGPIENYTKHIAAEGTVLFTRYNGNPEFVGVCAVVPKNCPETVHPDKLIRVEVPKEILRPEMLVLLASAGEGREYLRSKIRTTAGQSGISGGDLKTLRLKIPPMEVQHQIIAEVERCLSIVDRAEAQIDTNFHRSDRLRQSILKKAFSGQLAK